MKLVITTAETCGECIFAEHQSDKGYLRCSLQGEWLEKNNPCSFGEEYKE